MFNPLYLLTFLPTWLAGMLLLWRVQQKRDQEQTVPISVEVRREA